MHSIYKFLVHAVTLKAESKSCLPDQLNFEFVPKKEYTRKRMRLIIRTSETH